MMMVRIFLIFAFLIHVAAAHAQHRMSINGAGDIEMTWGVHTPEVDVAHMRIFTPNMQLRSLTPEHAGDTLELAFFTGRQYDAIVQQVSTDSNGVTGITARIVGCDAAFCYITASDDGISLSAEVPADNALFHTYLKDGNCWIAERKLQDVSYISAPAESTVARADAGRPAVRSRTSAVRAPGNSVPVTVDLMVVYTPAARAHAEANYAGGIHAMISAAMQRANTVLTNSETYVTLYLVHSAEVNYVEAANPNQDLDHITEMDDGIMDEVHILRGQYGADLVCLLVANTGSGVAGSGWILKYPDDGYPEHGFSAVRVDNIADAYTMIHEIGHNFGCGHHREIDKEGSYPFSHGRRAKTAAGTPYSTVMTYETNGSYTTDPYTPYSRIPYFSSPDIMYEGSAIGDAALEDNAETIRRTKTVVSNYGTDFLHYDTFLDNITVSEGVLVPAFDPVVKNYTVAVSAGTSSIDIIGTPRNPPAFIIGGGPNIPLSADEQTVTLEVLSDWSSYSKTYTVKVVRKPAAPPVVFPSANAIIYHPEQTLADVALINGLGDGTFAWDDPNAVPVPAISSYGVTFTPRDATAYDYTGVAMHQAVPLTVHRAVQTITFPAIPVKRITDAPFTLNASVSTGLPLAYGSSSEAVAVVDNAGTVTVMGTGSTDITASQAGNAFYAEQMAVQTLTVVSLPAPPQVVFPTAADAVYNPDRTLADVALSGASGDGVFAWADPAAVPTADNHGYRMIFTPRDAVNYDYTGIALEQTVLLTVHKAVQVITFAEIPAMTTSDAPFRIDASVNTGLPLICESSDEAVATVDDAGNVVIHGAGTVMITVCQQGGVNYTKVCVSRALTVTQTVTSAENPSTAGSDYIYPNPVLRGGELRIVCMEHIRDAAVEIYDSAGSLLRHAALPGASGDAISVQAPDKAGVYLFLIRQGSRILRSVKVIVQ